MYCKSGQWLPWCVMFVLEWLSVPAGKERNVRYVITAVDVTTVLKAGQV